MTRSAARLIGVAVAALAAGAVLRAQQSPQELPRFRSSIELTSMDVSVFDDHGRPIADLAPEEFRVRIDGDERRVVSAEWISLETPAGPPAQPPPDGFSTNDSATGGRLILIVIDQPNIRFGGTVAIHKAMFSFIDRLQPADRAAVVAVGAGAMSTPFTADRERLKKAIEGMAGQYRQRGPSMFLHGLSLSEASNIRRGALNALGDVVDRECRDAVGGMLAGVELDICTFEIEQQANDAAIDTDFNGRQTLTTIRSLLIALRQIDAPKTMILVSEGFVVQDQLHDVLELSSLSAAARTSIYAIKLDDAMYTRAAAGFDQSLSPLDDRFARVSALESLVSASRGTLFNVIGSGQNIFERVSTELSGYYLLGLESGPSDRDGKAHPIRVDVNRKDATVRTRRAIIASTAALAPRNPREAVAAALSTPLPISALPLRLATFALQGPELHKIQLLIHADIGVDYSSSRSVSVGYVITDREGRVVESHASMTRLPPVMSGVPSPLQFSAGASLLPGDYFMKLAVAEGDRVGTIEHMIHAKVADTGELRVSDLMVGGPVATREEILQPTVGYRVAFGALHGYLEAYGEGARNVTARYEVMSDTQESAVLDADVTPRMAGRSRAIFTHVLPVRQLPPGRYSLRVTLSASGQAVKVVTRPFEVEPPSVLMASATSATAMMSELYLPVPDRMLLQEFNPHDAARPSVVRSFRDRIPPPAQASFDRGVQALAGGALSEAETNFRSVIDPDHDSSAAISYLGAVLAASGRDVDAAGAWQTALIDGNESPDVYEWLVGSLMRSRDLATARSFLEEASTKWPTDARFAKPMALIYAMFGQGVLAVRSLERHLTEHKDDVDALFTAVEWLYQLRQAGASAHSPAEDLKLAKRYADAYAKSKGPQGALVRQWIAFLEKRTSVDND